MPPAVIVAYAVFLCAMTQISIAAQMRARLADPSKLANAPWLSSMSYLLNPLYRFARFLAMLGTGTFLMFFARTPLTIAVFVGAMLLPVVLHQSDIWVRMARYRYLLDVIAVVGLLPILLYALDNSPH